MIYDAKSILAAFAKRKSVAIKKYKQFVEEMQALIDGDKELSEIPSSQRRPTPRPLAEYKTASDNRNTAIISAYKSGGYTLKKIGDYFGLNYSSVSGIIRYHKSKT